MSVTSNQRVQYAQKERRVSLSMNPESYDKLGILAKYERRSRHEQTIYLVDRRIEELGGIKKIKGALRD